jgi:hypothetical protein
MQPEGVVLVALQNEFVEIHIRLGRNIYEDVHIADGILEASYTEVDSTATPHRAHDGAATPHPSKGRGGR